MRIDQIYGFALVGSEWKGDSRIFRGWSPASLPEILDVARPLQEKCESRGKRLCTSMTQKQTVEVEDASSRSFFVFLFNAI